jgi:hypothetical protein
MAPPDQPSGSPADPSWQSCSVGGSGDDVLAMCRAIPAILNVSGSTSGGPVTVTLTGTTSGDPKYKPITMYVEFYGNTRVELEQTDWSVRPRDARDKAADCDTYWRDCWPSGSHWAWLKGIRSGLLTGQDLNSISPVFELKLEPPAYRNGKWLAGTSTNFGQDKEDVPDYIFEAGENSPYYTISPDGLSISNRGTIDAEANLANVTVTSRDYGGVANLKLTVTLGSPANGPGFGVPIPTDEVWGILPGGSASGKVPPPDSKCGTGAFASLPVDYDCNGIADSWEAQYANTLLGAGLDHFPDTSIDTDGGNQGNATQANLQGDGLPVHDEYRGFHVRSPQTGEATWISTDPTRQDLFYWNVDKIGKTSLDKWGQAVFARVLGTTTHDFMDIHAVDKLQSNGNSGAVPYSTKPDEQTSPINKILSTSHSIRPMP